MRRFCHTLAGDVQATMQKHMAMEVAATCKQPCRNTWQWKWWRSAINHAKTHGNGSGGDVQATMQKHMEMEVVAKCKQPCKNTWQFKRWQRSRQPCSRGPAHANIAMTTHATWQWWWWQTLGLCPTRKLSPCCRTVRAAEPQIPEHCGSHA